MRSPRSHRLISCRLTVDVPAHAHSRAASPSWLRPSSARIRTSNSPIVSAPTRSPSPYASHVPTRPRA